MDFSAGLDDLFHMGMELSSGSPTQVAVFVVSPSGQLHQYSSSNGVLDRVRRGEKPIETRTNKDREV
jgi:hypothetical protein